MQAISKWNERKNGNPAAWRQHIETFYRDHAEFVVKAMAMDPDRAKHWCEAAFSVALKWGPQAFDDSFVKERISLLAMEALRQ
jgi:hypothetical protein